MALALPQAIDKKGVMQDLTETSGPSFQAASNRCTSQRHGSTWERRFLKGTHTAGGTACEQQGAQELALYPEGDRGHGRW